MNTYKITFTRENGTVSSDNFTAPSEAQARRDFKEVYRHGNGTITSVELVSSDAPATKRQERAALEKIRKIVDELGPDSYIATAFDGCFKDAGISDTDKGVLIQMEDGSEFQLIIKQTAKYDPAYYERPDTPIH